MVKYSATAGTARAGMSHAGICYFPKTLPAKAGTAKAGYSRCGVYITTFEKLKKQLELLSQS